jgi:hypothetical protein
MSVLRNTKSVFVPLFAFSFFHVASFVNRFCMFSAHNGGELYHDASEDGPAHLPSLACRLFKCLLFSFFSPLFPSLDDWIHLFHVSILRELA